VTPLLELVKKLTIVDIAPFWPKDPLGEPKSVNSVYESIKGTPCEIGRNTLRLALDGRLDRGYFGNLKSLALLCSQWAGREVTVDELLKDNQV